MTASTGKPKLDRLTLIIIGTFLILFIMVNSQADTYQWQGYCFPRAFLTPASYMQVPSNDDNYDSDDGYGPSISFNNEYLGKNIDGYEIEYKWNTSTLLAHIMANLSVRPFMYSPEYQKDIAFDVKETDSLIFNRGESKWEWIAFEKVENDFQFWGTCSLDGNGETSYDCLRKTKINGLSVSYDIKDVNMAKYKKVDNLIKQHLDSWQCKNQ